MLDMYCDDQVEAIVYLGEFDTQDWCCLPWPRLTCVLACSFAHDNSVQRKGVKFGSKLKVGLTVKQTRNWLIVDMYSLFCQTEMEVAEKLGRLSRLAPGGQVKIPSFAEENKHNGKGVPFGRRVRLAGPEPLPLV